MVFEEYDGLRAAAQRFESYGASAGIGVDEERALYFGLQNIEERFTQAGAGGAQRMAARACQAPAAEFSSDNSHSALSHGGKLIAALPFAAKKFDQALQIFAAGVLFHHSKCLAARHLEKLEIPQWIGD